MKMTVKNLRETPKDDLIGETVFLDPAWHSYFEGLYSNIDLKGAFTVVAYNDSGRNLTITFRDQNGAEDIGTADNFIVIDVYDQALQDFGNTAPNQGQKHHEHKP